MEKVPLCDLPVEDLEAVYFDLLLHVEPLQLEFGTQRSDEPVSKSRLTVTPGVPILTRTTYSMLFAMSKISCGSLDSSLLCGNMS